MPQGVRICKICGKEYPYCKTKRPAGISRWQDVACSPEHATIYFTKIAESRSGNAAVEDTEENSATVIASDDVVTSDDVGLVDDIVEEDETVIDGLQDSENEPETEM